MINLALGPGLSSVPMDDALNGRQSYSSAFELFSRVQTLKPVSYTHLTLPTIYSV